MLVRFKTLISQLILHEYIIVTYQNSHYSLAPSGYNKIYLSVIAVLVFPLYKIKQHRFFLWDTRYKPNIVIINMECENSCIKNSRFK
jgi:hypothetical protein